jgi:hypothetical protein
VTKTILRSLYRGLRSLNVIQAEVLGPESYKISADSSDWSRTLFCIFLLTSKVVFSCFVILLSEIHRNPVLIFHLVVYIVTRPQVCAYQVHVIGIPSKFHLCDTSAQHHANSHTASLALLEVYVL